MSSPPAPQRRDSQEMIVTADTPLSQNRVLRTLARFVLRLFGWRVEGELPNESKYVLIGAPHTSNWDWGLMILAGAYFGIRPYWMGKKELFPQPFAGLMRWLGGIPIDRSSAHQVVEQMVQAFEAHERMVVIITPEGTRSWAPKWKLGFYHIAKGAGVPVVLAYVDFPRKVAGIGPTIYPSDEMEDDLHTISAFYADKRGKFPENAGPVLPEG